MKYPLLNFIFFRNHPIVTILFFTIILTSFTGFFSQRLSQTYYNNYPYTPDPVGAMLNNVKISEQLQTYSKVEVVINELQTNYNCPFRTIPLIIFAPSLLLNPWGHMITTLLMFACFLSLLGYFVYVRSNYHLLYAITSILSFSTILVIYAPYFGLGSYVLDFSAGLPLASAAICLLLWQYTYKLKWLICFSVFLSFAILSRYIVCVYSFIVFSPILVYSTFTYYKSTKNIYSGAIRPLLTVLLIVGLLCGYFIIKHYNHNYQYYSYWASQKGVTLNFGIKKSSYSFLYTYLGFFALYHTILIGIFILINIFLLKGRLKNSVSDVLVSLWIFFSLPLYWIVGLGADGFKVSSAFLVAFPLMFLPIVSPFRLVSKKHQVQILTCASVVIVLISLLSFKRTYFKLNFSAQHPTEKEKDQKLIQQTVASILSKEKTPYAFDNFVADVYWNYGIALETEYRGGKLPATDYTKSLFITDWKLISDRFPKKTENETDSLIIDKLNKNYYLVVVFDQPNVTDTISTLLNQNSRLVAKWVAEKIKTLPNWEKTKCVSTSCYSYLAVYIKKK